MSGRRPDRRRLGEDERALFEKVMRSVRPLDPRDTVAAPVPAPAPLRPAARKPVPAAPGASAELAGIDRRTARKLERGRIGIEARLDLHGHDQATAHRRLARFVVEQATVGRKSVLVITGKGMISERSHDEPQRGVLRRLVPMWLAAPDLRPYVLGLRNAARQHGGAGAYYLLLRKPK